MALVATGDGGREWTRRASVGAFGWDFQGCPEVGGGLVAETVDGFLHAVVWTGADRRQGVYALGSRDDGRSWSKPVALGAREARNPDLARSRSVLAAVWEERGPLYWARTRDVDGIWRWSGPERLTQDSERAVHPIVVGTGDGRFLAAWTEQEGEGPWRFRSRVLGPDPAGRD